MSSEAISLLKDLQPNVASVYKVSSFLGFDVEKVESVRDLFSNDTIFELLRPNDYDGIFGYISIQTGLSVKTRANQYRAFYEKASLAMQERGQTSSEVDFILVVGEKILIIFDSADFRKRLILTPDKLSRSNSKYLTKFESLRISSVFEQYIEDDLFGDYELDTKFKTELFRFAIADDEQFINKTRIIRLNFWKRIQESVECHKILKSIFFKDSVSIDTESNYYGDVISAVLDTLVLRYILVRILEGRFGYENEVAKKSVSKIGLGTTMSIDKLLESKVRFDSEQKKMIVTSKKEELSLFDVTPYEISTQEVAEIHQTQINYMENVYGGDLYVSDIARAATKIESTLSESEYALIWSMTSSTELDFDLEDVTPGTIGEQYEQTLQMKLEKNIKGQWEYSKDNSQQRAQGSFYTNAQITDYIIEQTLGKKLSEIKKALIHDAKTDSSRVAILKEVLKLKIADISSGGGTFLAGMVRKLGNWYSELEQVSEISKLLYQIKEYKSAVDFQKYAVNHMIYGIDLDLKALIVSSFALTLESLGDTQSKLPELIGKTLIHQNALVSLVPESLKNKYFKIYQNNIKELYEEKKKWSAKKGNSFLEKRAELQQVFANFSVEYLQSKKFDKEILERTILDRNIEVLEFNLPEIFFNKEGEYQGGFDIIVGNPPYIQLQKKEIFSDSEKYIYQKLGEFESYEATGDIYALFYERGIKLLKEGGLLGYITSNKFLRSGYGQSLRNYLLENTNPYLLINLGSGMFGATVDTSILAVEKAKNQNGLKAVDLMQRSDDPRVRLENMSDYIEQQKIPISYKKDESWLILSPIEQSIKQKIESVGTPLKEWDIRINRGILTGYNEAFIIDKMKRDELIKQDPKSAEIIRPILRGRDIKKYGYEFAELYLICTFPSKNYDIDIYPAVRDYLLNFDKRKLEQSGAKDIDGIRGNNARKKTSNKWFETQDSIAYWDDFNRQKIVFSRISGDTPCFALDNKKCMINDTAYMIIGDNLEYLLEMLCSPTYWFAFRRFYMGGGIEREFKVNNLENLPIPLPSILPLQLTKEEEHHVNSFYND